MSNAIRALSGVVVSAGRATREPQHVVVEEPLTITIAGDVFSTTMRTPGEDRYLALGLLHAEGLVRTLDDVSSIFHCGRTDQPGYGNAIEVLPAARIDFERRHALSTSACGVCGRERIEELLRFAQRERAANVPASLIAHVPHLLSQVQPLFAESGGAHAACAITRDGRVVVHAEDVGRHNAVDKVIGKLLYERRMPDPAREDTPLLLAVSARAGFEIVQKAAVAGFACVATVSAPSSLAVEAAQAAGVTLASFVREGRFTLYTHAARVLE